MARSTENPRNANTPQDSPVQGAVNLIGSVVSLVGFLLLVMAGVNTIIVYTQTRSWRSVEGQVVSADIYQTAMKSLGGLRKGQGYGVRYLIRYTVGSIVYISTADAGIQSWNRATMEKTQKELPEGTKVKVRYHPDNTAFIKLVGTGLWTFAPFAWLLLKFGVIIVTVGLAILFVSRRLARS